MSKHCFPVATGRAPRRRVVDVERRARANGGSLDDDVYEFLWMDVYETLECGHERWAGTVSFYQPAKVRACQACKQEG